ncbi:MAG: hypothetical protein A3F90_18230 [Deltaproteobacteria bacterium RIFCSPLOWO2_12_FULL_60_19]|nr:MAG: hypothetical protein A3F90_18230 [Deltaproteobacteria bacterium RIFCSPLOWO2_12_FULL_60_19]
MGYASAVGSAKAPQGDRSASRPAEKIGPSVLAADRIVGVPDLVEFGRRSEIVDMPMGSGRARQMMLDTSPDPSRAERAADIDVSA